ncbi:MAG TPA: prepilin-type N-terminal cleavage/methylation domain-containing protein [Thermoanaerobaculia bacterium]
MSVARRAGGFALIELLVALVLLLLAIAIAAGVLMETSQIFVDSAADQLDPLPSLVIARIRDDVQQSSGYSIVPPIDSPEQLVLLGHPEGTIVYQTVGEDLVRSLVDEEGVSTATRTVLRDVVDWSAAGQTSVLLRFEITYRVHAGRRSPLPTVPGQRGPTSAVRTEALYLTLRGGGLGESW